MLQSVDLNVVVRCALVFFTRMDANFFTNFSKLRVEIFKCQHLY